MKTLRIPVKIGERDFSKQNLILYSAAAIFFLILQHKILMIALPFGFDQGVFAALATGRAGLLLQHYSKCRFFAAAVSVRLGRYRHIAGTMRAIMDRFPLMLHDLAVIIVYVAFALPGVAGRRYRSAPQLLAVHPLAAPVANQFLDIGRRGR